MSVFSSFYKKYGLSGISVFFALFVVIYIYINLSLWRKPDYLIAWDIKSYYAYFPALVIEKDHKLGFLDDPSYENKKYFWNLRTENKERIILTSMGLSMLYTPFVYIGHLVAPAFGYEQSGFSRPYLVGLVFSNFFYFMLGLIFLRKILLKYFTDIVAALGILVVFFGTNLYYYTVFSPLMSHGYNFSLIVIFLYLVIKWHENQKISHTILLGFIAGIIALIGPSNVLVIFILLLWGITSLKDLGERILLFIKKWYLVLLMILFFIVAWMPQMLYWHSVTGNVFYYTYKVSGGDFYFNNPQIINQLFSYRSGALMYSPVLFFAFGGLYFMFKKYKGLFIPSVVYIAVTYYLLAAWWSWWNGGSFGIRSYVDTYGIVILGFAAIYEQIRKMKKLPKYVITGVIIFMTAYGTLMNYQTYKGILHYDSNSKEIYWGSLFRLKKMPDYYEIAGKHSPDYFLARCGINAYGNREYNDGSKLSCIVNTLRPIEKDEELYRSYVEKAEAEGLSVYKYLRRMAEEKSE